MSLTVVARALKDFDGDPAVKRCLQALLSFELKSGESRSQYRRDYLAEIEKAADAWSGADDEN